MILGEVSTGSRRSCTSHGGELAGRVRVLDQRADNGCLTETQLAVVSAVMREMILAILSWEQTGTLTTSDDGVDGSDC